MSKVTVEFPLKNNGKNIGFDAIPEDKVEEAIKFNIKNIILTNPGEKTWDVEFGVGIMQALFEPATESLIEKIRERMVELNNETHWVPGFIGEKRFSNW